MAVSYMTFTFIQRSTNYLKNFKFNEINETQNGTITKEDYNSHSFLLNKINVEAITKEVTYVYIKNKLHFQKV